MDVDKVISSLQEPSKLIIGLLHQVTGWFYPYLPIYLGFALLILARLLDEFPSPYIWLMWVLPFLLLDLWALYVFVVLPITVLQRVIGLIGLALFIAFIFMLVRASEMSDRQLAF